MNSSVIETYKLVVLRLEVLVCILYIVFGRFCLALENTQGICRVCGVCYFGEIALSCTVISVGARGGGGGYVWVSHEVRFEILRSLMIRHS